MTRLKLVVVLIIGLVLSLVVFTVVQRLVHKEPYVVTANQFMTALTTNDADASYALLNDALKKGSSASDWKTSVATNFQNFSGEAKLIKTEPVNDPAAAYGKTGNPYKMTYSLSINSRPYNIDLVVYNTNNSWKIGDFQSYTP